MKKTFIPKTLELTPEVLEEIKRRFALPKIRLDEIIFWNGEGSDYHGTVIDVEGDHICSPSPYKPDEFKNMYPDGEVWGEPSPPPEILPLDWKHERARIQLCAYCTGSPPGNSCNGDCFTRKDWEQHWGRNREAHLRHELRALWNERRALDLREAQLRAALEEMEKNT